MSVGRWCLGALMLTGCLAAKPIPPVAVKPTYVTSVPMVFVNVDDHHVTIDGKEVAYDAKAVGDALAKRKEERLGLEITLGTERDRAVVEALVTQSGWREIVLRLGELELQLEGKPYFQDTSAHPIIVYALFSEETIRLWRIDSHDDSTGELPSIKRGDATSARLATQNLEQLCHGDMCSAFVFIPKMRPIVATLKEWKLLAGSIPAYVSPAHPIEANASGTTNKLIGTGRLAPEIIQGVVRYHFKDLRTCYEEALTKDPKMQGKMSTKFVIGRDGKVTSSENAGSTFTDPELNDCIVKVFKTIAFPPPDGGDGIVTVVYPIWMAPD